MKVIEISYIESTTTVPVTIYGPKDEKYAYIVGDGGEEF